MYINESENITDVIVERMECFETTLQNILKKAIKVSMKLVAGNGKAINYFKSIYSLTLRKPAKLNGSQMAEHLVQLLEKMEAIPVELP